MSKNVADALWELLQAAGVRRCYGIVGDALNPTIDALRRNGSVEFIHVRHEEYGGFAAVADAYLTNDPVAICGTAGPGVTHLINAMIDARKEGAPIIVIAGVVAVAQVSGTLDPVVRVNAPILRPADPDLRRLAAMIDAAERVTIFGGDGCRNAHDDLVALATKLKAPVGYAFRGKQYLEYDNPNAVGMSGLIGYGGAHLAMHEADLLLLLGTDFPFSEFLPDHSVKKVQIDREPEHLGRRTPIDLGLVGNIEDTVAALLPLVTERIRPNISIARSRRRANGTDRSPTTSSAAQRSRPFVPSIWSPRSIGSPPTTPSSASIRGRRASGPPATCARAPSAASSVRSAGHRWKVQRRTRWVRNWHLPDAKRSL